MLSWRMARRMSGSTVAAAVTLALLVPVPAHADGTVATAGAPGAVSAAPPPVDIKTTDVPAVAPAPETSPHRVVARLDQTETSPFRMIGVTWAPNSAASDVTVEVRTRTDGTWSGWTPLEVDSDESTGNPGTEGWWVGKADGVAARVTSAKGTPKDVKITTIDTGDAAEAEAATPASWSGPVDGVADAVQTAAEGSPAYTPKPSIMTRGSWGAAKGTSCDSPISGDRTRGVIVHHTAGSNSYSKADSKAIVRSTQAYHMKARKWCDIGYNFLVDKYGQIFEGRAGGVDRAVRAAHSGNLAVNTYTMGVSMMGNYDVTRPSAALKDAMVKLIGWRLGTNYLPAKGTYSLGGKTLNMIAGHRNVISTACPGKYGYAWLSEKGGLRDRAANYIAKYSTPVKTRWKALGSAKTGAIFIGESKSSTGSRLWTKSMELLSEGNSTARIVSGTFLTEYNRMGSRTGALGYPRSDAAAVTGATRQIFKKGRIYLPKGKSKAYSMTGAISTMYVALGETGGALGVPTSSTSTKSGVSKVTFAKGYITQSGSKTTAYDTRGKVIKGSSAPSAKPANVTGLTISAGTHSVRLSWKPVSGATGYNVCLLTSRTATSCAKSANPGTATTTLVPSLTTRSGTDYYVKLRALKGSVAGNWSALAGFNLKASTSVESKTVPSSGTLTLKGRGYGHGIGMSQYGAQGAAKKGVKYDKILATYYPGTKLSTKSGSIRVLLSQDTTDSVDIAAASGLYFRDVRAGKRSALPTTVNGAKVTRWRILQLSSNKAKSTLQYRTSDVWKSYKSTHWTGDGQFEGPSAIGLIMPNGSTVRYRGALRSAPTSAGSTARNTVNVLTIEDYLRGVVGAEMPSGWSAEALKAQAVAARTYGARSLTSSRYYDICDTTACQVYGGVARETASINAAITATKGKILTYGGSPALAQFSSSSGGYTAVGSEPYLKAVADPYDDWSGNPNRSWSATVKASTVQKAYPAIGTLKQLKITKRAGGGTYGGRVASISLVGSKKTVAITGTDARWAFGLKSNWFAF
ncbi:SpoIID/LytB domain-containing protein [Aeromicrobium sp. P5_D10]